MRHPHRASGAAEERITERLRRAVIRWPDQLNPQELLSLKRQLSRLTADVQFDVLAQPFLHPPEYGNPYLAQEYAGRLLVEIAPPCTWPLDEVLRNLLPGWNRSVEEFAFYLASTFGRDVVLAALAPLDDAQQVERAKTDTVRFWLREPISSKDTAV